MPAGKISYIELPATDVDRSAEFYRKIFGWSIRSRGDGSRAFDDTTGAVSGTWVTGRAPSREAGMVTYIQVDDVEATLKKVQAQGGKAGPITHTDHGLDHATFHDPAGNILG